MSTGKKKGTPSIYTMRQPATQTQELDAQIVAVEEYILHLKMQKLKLDAYRKGTENLTVSKPVSKTHAELNHAHWRCA